MKFTLRNKSSELILCFIAFVGIFFSIGFIQNPVQIHAQQAGQSCNPPAGPAYAGCNTWPAYPNMNPYLVCTPVQYSCIPGQVGCPHREGYWEWGGMSYCGSEGGATPPQTCSDHTRPVAPVLNGSNGHPHARNLSPQNNQIFTVRNVNLQWYFTAPGWLIEWYEFYPPPTEHIWGNGCPNYDRQYVDLEMNLNGSWSSVWRVMVGRNDLNYQARNLANGSYRWRVVLDNGGGLESQRYGYGAWATFRVNVCSPSNPTSPVLTAPPDTPPDSNTRLSTSSVTLRWDEPSSWGTVCGGAQSNQVRVQSRLINSNGTCPGPGNVIWNESSTTTTAWLSGTTNSRVLTGLQTGQGYCWRVQARNSTTGVIVNSNPVSSRFRICIPEDVGRAVNTFPQNNQAISGVSTELRWDAPSTWGNTCPDPLGNNRYRVQLDQGCTGAYVNQAYQLSGVRNYVLNNLVPGTSYCWRVETSNGASINYSNRTSFTTPSLPSISTGSGIVAGTDTCGNGYSGRLSLQGTTNPVRMVVSGNVQAGGTPRMVVLALLPTTGSYAENAQFVDWDTALTKAINSNSYIGGYNGMTNRYYTSNSSNVWAHYGSGSVSNGANTVRAVGLGGSTNVAVNGSNIVGNFLLEINDTFPNGMYNIYAMVDKQLEDGGIISSDMNGSTRRLRRMGTWGIDTQSPSIVMADPIFSNSPQNTFTMRYSISDIAGGSGVSQRYLDMRSSDQGARLSTSLGGANIVFSQANVFEFKRNLPNTNNEQVITFTNLTPELQSDLDVRLRALDLACNQAERSGVATLPVAWALFKGASYYGSSNNMIAPNASIDLSDLISYNAAASISDGIGMVGTNQYPRRRGSLRGMSVLAYINRALGIPLTSDNESWFAYLVDLANKNATSISNITRNNFSGNISAYLEVPANSSHIIYVRPSGGTLTIWANSTCNARAVVFIEGNLSISPHFRNGGASDGCVFIVSGNVNILPGGRAGAAAVGSSVLANYDELHAFIMAGGQVTIQEDPHPNSNIKPDPLLIRGSIVSENITIQRDMGAADNIVQPSVIVEYDPRYLDIASTYLKLRNYKIREVLP